MIQKSTDDYPSSLEFGLARKDEESVTKSPPRAHHDYFAVRPPPPTQNLKLGFDKISVSAKISNS